MAKSVYLAALDADGGKSVIALGLAEAMARRWGAVGVFRPVSHGAEADRIVDLLYPRLHMDLDRAACVGTSYDAVRDDPEAALSLIVDRYHQMASACDTVLIVGTDYTDVASVTEFEFNLRVAVNLAAPVVLVVAGASRTAREITAAVRVGRDQAVSSHATVAGVIVNRVSDSTDIAPLRSLSDTWTVPETAALSAPTVEQFATTCHAELLSGEPEMLGRPAGDVLVAAMTLPNVLDHLDDDVVVITPGDRSAILLGLLVAHQSPDLPSLAGIILTGGLRPSPQILGLLSGLDSRLPVLLTTEDTFTAATNIGAVRGRITPSSAGKIATALGVFASHVDSARLLESIRATTSEAVTPLMFEHRLVERARQRRCRVVLPEATEPRVLRAADIVLRRAVADVVLVGDSGEISTVAADLGVDISTAQIVSVADEEPRARFAAEYARLRAHKGITEELAADIVADETYFATMMVHFGLADGMVSGAAHTTAQTIRPAFEIIKTQADVSVVSSVFFMCLPEHVLVYGDCAVIPEPAADQLADIAVSSADTAAIFGIDPKVALLSYSTGSSGTGDDVDKVREAAALVRSRKPDLLAEGPIQYDAAVDAGVASAKLPDSAVAGRATVFIVPDLNTGNNLYKAVQRSAGAVAVGPVLQGLRKPVNDLSRGATVGDIVNTIALTAVQAAEGGQ